MLSLIRIKRVFQERNVPTFHIQCSNKGPFQNKTLIPAQQNKIYDTQTMQNVKRWPGLQLFNFV